MIRRKSNFEKFKKQSIENANIALKNRLFVSGWILSQALVHFRDVDSDQNIYVHIEYKDEKPIGVLVLFEHGTIWSFVRKSERRKGVGRSMIKSVTTLFGMKTFNFEDGVKGSYKFHMKLRSEIK